MKRINLLRSSFLFLLFPFFLTSCGGNTTETPKEYSATNPRTIKEVNLDSEPVELVAPFTVLTETGETPEELEYRQFIQEENRSFVTLSMWATPDPVAVWTKASGMFVPVAPKANGGIVIGTKAGE